MYLNRIHHQHDIYGNIIHHRIDFDQLHHRILINNYMMTILMHSIDHVYIGLTIGNQLQIGNDETLILIKDLLVSEIKIQLRFIYQQKDVERYFVFRLFFAFILNFILFFTFFVPYHELVGQIRESIMVVKSWSKSKIYTMHLLFVNSLSNR